MTRKEGRGAKCENDKLFSCLQGSPFNAKRKIRTISCSIPTVGQNWIENCTVDYYWIGIRLIGKEKGKIKKIHLVQKMSRSFQMPDIRLNKLTASLNHQHFLSQTCQEFSDWLQLYHYWDEKNLSKCKMLYVMASLSPQKE